LKKRGAISVRHKILGWDVRKQFAGLLLAALALSGCGAHHHAGIKPPVAGKVLLTDVTVVNTRDGSLAPGMNLLMDKGKIVSITPASNAPTGANVTTIDTHGKFVVPGFTDMHAHVLENAHPNDMLTLMLSNGITGWRQMNGSPELLKERREGTLPMSGLEPALLSMPGVILTPLNAWSPESGVAQVDEERAEGADFIKVILVNAPTFFAAQAEAKRLHIPFAGHLPAGVDIVAASKGGMTSVEHLGAGTDLLIPCSTDEAVLRAAIAKAPPIEGFPFNVVHLLPFRSRILQMLLPRIVVNTTSLVSKAGLVNLRHMMSTYDENKCKRLAAEFVADGTWQDPTLNREKTSMEAADPEFLKSPHNRYMAPEELADWWTSERKFAAQFSAADRKTFRDYHDFHLRLVKLFDEVGVKLLIGEDAGGAGWVVPGFAIHQEFDEFQKAGVSPLHILQDTTINAAQYLGRTSTMGTVEPGKNADLVLLDANPIESAQNLHKIYAVVRDGHYLSRQDLDEALSKLAAKQAKAAAH
jgi:hypothetical protein